MEKWIVTGISGSGRIELLEELAQYCSVELKKKVLVHDVGDLIRRECERTGNPLVDEKILDVDRQLLSVLRSSALKDVRLAVLENANADLHLIGIHACFRWRNRLIPGISFSDLVGLQPDGFIHVHRNVDDIVKTNTENPKWEPDAVPDFEKTQNWMMEEEFITEVLAQVIAKPVFIVSRDHNLGNLADLWFSDKRRVYLSYPISEIRKDQPELLQEIQGPILERLEGLFVVFNPLAIQDMPLTYPGAEERIPDLIDQLNTDAKDIIKKRTIERDYQFIDQSDAVVVFYLTNKMSPGVLGEIYYAHRNMKPVFMALAARRSPFIEDAADIIEETVDALFPHLEAFASEA